MKKFFLSLTILLSAVAMLRANDIQTVIINKYSQPILVGGHIDNYSEQDISKKGIIVSKSVDDMIITADTEFNKAEMFLCPSESRTNNPHDLRFIDCTNVNKEQFACALQFLNGNTDYYVKAFIIDTKSNIYYGNAEKVHTQDYNRYDGYADYANVYYYTNNTLFDVVTDEIIDINDGYYATTNESPLNVSYQTSGGAVYKLATEWNYKLWYSQVYHGTIEDNNSKIVHLPIMKYANGQLKIEKNPLDDDKDITIYYSINGNYFRPETYTDIYSTPLEISEPCIVYCYAISSEGYISYTNLYAIGNYTINQYKSLDDYIAISDITIKEDNGVTINPIIQNVKKIYIDLTNGTTNSADCYSTIYSYDSIKSITYSSKYLQSTTSDNIILTENKKDTRLNIKDLADNKTYSWLYYNPQNPDEVIIDAEEFLGCLGYIADWQINFGTSCVVNIVTSSSEDNLEKVADMVDLGLSVKWASWNIGASKIADYGGLYGAGDPTGLLTSTSYDDYHWVEGEDISGTEYDLAHVKWGGKWQLPTSAQLLELKEKCTWEHDVTIDNVIGSVATGPNGNTIFFPYAGCREGSSNSYFGKHASLWASEAFFDDVRNYKDMDINLPSGSFQFDGCKSYCGQSIRPVYVEEKPHLTECYTEVEYIQAPKEKYTSSQAWTVPNNLQENYNYIFEFTPLDWEDSYYGNIIGGHDGDSVFPNLGIHKLDNGWGGMEKRFITAFWNYNLETRDQSPGGNYRVYSGVRSRFQLHCKNYDSSQGAEIIVDNEGYETYSYTSTSIYRSGYSVETGVYDIPLFTQTGNTTDMAAFMQLHNFKVEDKNGKVVYDYVPCVRNSDSKVGLYDRVNDAFYYPSAFDLTAGAEVQNVPTSRYKSLDDYIKESSLDTISNDMRIHISPKITNVKKVYIDLEKGSNNSSWCYLWINNSNMNSKFIEISSKYLQSESTDNFVLWENDNENRLSIKKIADDKTFSWLYYNPDNCNEVIIDIEHYLGGLGFIENWQQNFETSCIVNIVTDSSNNQSGEVAEVVDLGLSVKWASWNIGASKIGDYGGLYGAGDPTGLKTSTNPEDYYFKDGESICGTEYDLAHVKWGGEWRMPNWKEVEELINNCTWTTGEVDGVKGSWATGPNGNSIFLPWAGNRYGESTFSDKDEKGYYYSGDMGVAQHNSGYKDFDIDASGVWQTDGAENYWGQSIRPVYGEIATYELSIKSTGNGFVTYDSTIIRDSTSTFYVSGGGSATITLTPDEDHYVKSIVVNGENDISGISSNQYTINMINSNTIVEVEFNKKNTTGTIAEIVDLGLSVKWASWNIGASAPEEKGYHLAWGEIEPKDNYDQGTYKYYYDNGYIKYGEIDGKYQLEQEDDAAYQLWGAKWRTPTYEELEELCTKCTISEEEVNGVKVAKVVGPNGNYIYFPYSGNYTGTSLFFENSVGSYWCSNLDSNSYAKDMDLQNGNASLNGDYRYHGQCVRPVYDDIMSKDSIFGSVAEIVDLGLSVKWASWNIGADRPEGYGHYFSWGEVSPKEDYSWDTYKFGNPPNKYNTDDGKTSLESDDDAATILWGGKWRMPTAKEEEELFEKCTWEYTEQNSVNGFRITGPNGNSIFLPAAGLYDASSSLANENSGGWYWASTLTSNQLYARGIYFVGTSVSIDITSHDRCDGHVIRPVYGETTSKDSIFGEVADVVDLGLSVKWSSWSLGASKIEDYGGLYGVGDPTGLKTSSDPSDYYYEENANICGTEYDLAHIKWGADWRLPTTEELKELMEKCTWESNVTKDGVIGSVATGPNGNTLFFPYSGCRAENSNSYFEKHASIWSGETGYAGDVAYSYSYNDLDINFSGIPVRLDGCENYRGQTIRPVYGKIENKPITYDLSIKAIGNGSVSYGDSLVKNNTKTFILNEGASAIITLTPDEGFIVKSLIINKIDVTSEITNNQYSIESINKSIIIEVTFGDVNEPYAVLSEDNTVLTFYYDDQKEARNGMSVGPFEYNAEEGETISLSLSFPKACSWYNQREQITNVVFDASFANCNTITSTATWFYGCTNLTTITGISNLNTENVTDMGFMFTNCSDLSIIDVSGFKTDNVTSMISMFSGCSELTSIDVSNFNTANVTRMGRMFEGCSRLQEIEVSGFKTENVTSMSCMFSSCSRLKTLDVSGFNTKNVTNFAGMFYNCSRLTSLYVNSFITDNATTMHWMFYQCSSLTYLDVSKFKTNKVEQVSRMFGGCKNLKTIYAGDEWTFANIVTSEYMFDGCTSLIGGMGTIYDSSHTDHTYARIDGGTTNPGYFTQGGIYQLSIKSIGEGSVTYNNIDIKNNTSIFSVVTDESATITLSPDTGYRLKSLSVNGTDATSAIAENQYTICNIKWDIFVEVEFEPILHTMSVKSTGNGSIKYEDISVRNNTCTFDVIEESSAIITISPDDGSRLKILIVDGTDVTSSITDSLYTISNIKDNINIEAEFYDVLHTLSIKARGNGSITYGEESIRNNTTIFSVKEMSSVIISLKPDNGYRLYRLISNEVDVTSAITNNQYTISSFIEDTNIEAEFVIQSFDSDGISYNVVSYDDKTINVASGDYGLYVNIPNTFSAHDIEWTVVGVENGAFSNATDLAAIVWEPECKLTESVSNPNLLLYVKSKDYAPSGINNVIVNNIAESIVLTDAASGNNFYCPQDFTAEQIIYEHNYSMKTGYNTCQGWETIVLPFDVAVVTNNQGTELVPYKKWEKGNSQRPFWLYTMNEDGWVASDGIMANIPYIICMPNNEFYNATYNQIGNIAFRASNVKVEASTNLSNIKCGHKIFVPNYQTYAQSTEIFALNVNNSIYTYTESDPVEGSAFIRGLRDVGPFEAYMMIESNISATRSISIFGDEETTGIMDLPMSTDHHGNNKVYSLSGRLIKQGKDDRDIQNLPKGVYIINGKKVIK